MIDVSNDFKTAIKTAGRQILAYVKLGETEITHNDDLQSIRIITNGSLCRAVMREASFSYFGTHSFLGEYVNIGMGIKTGYDEVEEEDILEYIDYGSFRGTEISVDKSGEVTTLKCYDKMYEALQVFAIEPEYPVTTMELVQAICTELGWDLGVEDFPNDDISIASDLFTDGKMTYRDVLNQIAEASGSIIYFNTDDELMFRQISDSVLGTLTSNELGDLTVKEEWGELNSLVLSRQPQEDNIVAQDETSIGTYGLNEFKIVNNLIVDGDRETYITPIFTVLNGIKYHPFVADTVGLGYFEVGDRIEVEDRGETAYEVLVFDIDISITGGLKETIGAKVPEKSTTPYQYAGILGKRITSTEIIVNKQEGEIQILNEAMETVATIPRQATEPESPSENDLWLNTTDNIIYRYDGAEWVATSISPDSLEDYYTKDETSSVISTTADQINASVESVQSSASNAQALADANSEEIISLISQLTELGIDVDGLGIKVESLGGTNLLKNSVGLKGSLTEWQELDEDGEVIDADNDGTIVQTSDVEENSESGSAIMIENQFIIQNVATIVGATYTFYCRFKKLEDLTLNLTGIAEDIEMTAEDYVDETWAVFKYQFTATDTTTTVKVSNVDSEEGAYAILTDLVLKMGEVTGWVQAPNEVYGKNFRFDKDGLTVTSITDEFKAILDNVKLGIYDASSGTDKVMALFSKDAGLITQLTAQDEFILQRYNNSDASTRFIPTATGCMITVNDT